MTLSRGNLPLRVHLPALPGRSSQAILEYARASSTHKPLLGAFGSRYDAGSAGAAAAGLEARDRYDIGIKSISMAQQLATVLSTSSLKPPLTTPRATSLSAHHTKHESESTGCLEC